MLGANFFVILGDGGGGEVAQYFAVFGVFLVSVSVSVGAFDMCSRMSSSKSFRSFCVVWVLCLCGCGCVNVLSDDIVDHCEVRGTAFFAYSRTAQRTATQHTAEREQRGSTAQQVAGCGWQLGIVYVCVYNIICNINDNSIAHT